MEAQKRQNARIGPIILLVAAAGTKTIVSGMCLGFSSSSGDELMKSGKLDEKQNAWYGSLPILGTVFGSLAAVYTTEAWGRRTALFLFTAWTYLGWVLVLLALHQTWTPKVFLGLLYAGRCLQGMGSGIEIVVVAVYVSECATKDTRGRLICFNSVQWQFGIVLMFALGVPLSAKWLAVIPLILTLVAGALLFLLPESPSWLLKKKQRDKAIDALTWLRGKEFDIKEELQEKEESIAEEESTNIGFSLKDLKERSFIVPLLIGVCLAIIMLSNGISVVIVFSVQIIQDAGFESNAAVISVVTGIILLLFNAFPILFADHIGRRFFLLLGTFLNGICLILLGLYFYLTEVKGHEGLMAMSLTAILVFFAAYSLGLGSVVLTVLGEIFPLRARGAGFGMATVLGFIASFVVTEEYPSMKESMHTYGTFWFFAAINLLGTCITAFFLPETKGKSLEEIEDYFRGRKKKNEVTVITRL